MAASIWGTDRHLDAALFADGHQFEFFQAVRLLLLAAQERGQQESSLATEPLRFAVVPTLTFPSSSVVRIERDAVTGYPGVLTAFLGLLGPLGVLPHAYTEQAMLQAFAGDNSFAGFFDIFHHRLLWTFYRAWEKNRLCFGLERSGPPHHRRDRLTAYLLAIIGMHTDGLEDRLPCRDQALLRYAGLLAQRPRSAECLRALLADYLEIPVRIEQFVGRWHVLEEDECCALGMEQANSQLGRGAVAGDAVWACDTMVRAVLGPLPAEHFSRFLPDGNAFATTTALARWYIGPSLSFDVQPLLAAEEKLLWAALGEDVSGGPRLGWNAWLTETPMPLPASDAIFHENEWVGGGRAVCH